MILIKQYKNLITTSNPFLVSNNNLIVAQSNIFFSEKLEHKMVICNHKVYSFQTSDNENIAFQINHGSDILIVNDGNYYTIKGKFYLSSSKIFFNKLVIRGSYGDDTEKKLYAIDLKTRQLERFNLEIAPDFYCSEDKYIKKESNRILVKNTDNLPIWELDLGDLGSYIDEFSKQEVKGRVEELLVVNESVVVASVYRYGIVGISLQSGVILWQIPDIQKVVLHQGILYSFSDFYYEIDAISGQILREEDYKTLFQHNNFRAYWLTKPAIEENLIAIASHYDNALLLLNRANFSVIQRLELGKASNGIPLTNTPQFHQNRLYQLDGDSTLHIFEREAQ